MSSGVRLVQWNTSGIIAWHTATKFELEASKLVATHHIMASFPVCDGIYIATGSAFSTFFTDWKYPDNCMGNSHSHFFIRNIAGKVLIRQANTKDILWRGMIGSKYSALSTCLFKATFQNYVTALKHVCYMTLWNHINRDHQTIEIFLTLLQETTVGCSI